MKFRVFSGPCIPVKKEYHRQLNELGDGEISIIDPEDDTNTVFITPNRVVDGMHRKLSINDNTESSWFFPAIKDEIKAFDDYLNTYGLIDPLVKILSEFTIDWAIVPYWS